ncbi:MAG: phenylalanine--tRNA ligase subunit alpha [Candidatus Hydrogenedentes bacterium]|nr:phenylalanine--tRNA ligase subunit alpha [Candidatus Hydrogenedentota bacterium]
MQSKIKALHATSLDELKGVGNPEALEAYRVKWLGRKGIITDVLRGLSEVPAESRPALGQAANALKQSITKAVAEKTVALEASGGAGKSETPRLDLTLPGRIPTRGHHHLISQVMDEVVDIFAELGYQVASGPDIETEYYNFDALNTPKDHPARDSHDTFYIKPGVVLRTHTSPVQMRVMERTKPPVAVVVPGRVYRVDYDASHSPMFFQFEGLLIDKGITFADLKGTVEHLIHKLFGPDAKTRFRPHFFPFTEPSGEMDMSCTLCKGSGCRMCKNTGWLELAGCGMVHPELFQNANYDYEQYSGFAFGFGIDRIAILRHSLDTIHLLFDNDLRFLEQF